MFPLGMFVLGVLDLQFIPQNAQSLQYPKVTDLVSSMNSFRGQQKQIATSLGAKELSSHKLNPFKVDPTKLGLDRGLSSKKGERKGAPEMGKTTPVKEKRKRGGSTTKSPAPLKEAPPRKEKVKVPPKSTVSSTVRKTTPKPLTPFKPFNVSSIPFSVPIARPTSNASISPSKLAPSFNPLSLPLPLRNPLSKSSSSPALEPPKANATSLSFSRSFANPFFNISTRPSTKAPGKKRSKKISKTVPLFPSPSNVSLPFSLPGTAPLLNSSASTSPEALSKSLSNPFSPPLFDPPSTPQISNLLPPPFVNFSSALSAVSPSQKGAKKLSKKLGKTLSNPFSNSPSKSAVPSPFSLPGGDFLLNSSSSAVESLPKSLSAPFSPSVSTTPAGIFPSKISQFLANPFSNFSQGVPLIGPSQELSKQISSKLAKSLSKTFSEPSSNSTSLPLPFRLTPPFFNTSNSLSTSLTNTSPNFPFSNFTLPYPRLPTFPETLSKTLSQTLSDSLLQVPSFPPSLSLSLPLTDSSPTISFPNLFLNPFSNLSSTYRAISPLNASLSAASLAFLPKISNFSPNSSIFRSLSHHLSPKFHSKFFKKFSSKFSKLRKGKKSTKKPFQKKSNSSGSKRRRGKYPLILRRGRGRSKHYHNKTVTPSYAKEKECVKSLFLHTGRFPHYFSMTSSIYQRRDKTCRWNIIGSGRCLPTLSCNIIGRSPSCEEEYMDIVDGVGGERRVCGKKQMRIFNVQASRSVRDLYMKYRVVKTDPNLRNITKVVMRCRAACGTRRNGTRLETTFQPSVNPRCYCGTKPVENRIVGGEQAKKVEYPWLVALVETNTRQPFCGASILNNRFILTAAHCLKQKFTDYRNIQVVVNGHILDERHNPAVVIDTPQPKTYSAKTLHRLDQENGSRRFNLEEIIVHPLYVSKTNDFDVALLKLAEDLDLSVKTLGFSLSRAQSPFLQQPRTICLPPLGSYVRTYAGKKATVAGWGLPGYDSPATSPTMQKLQVNVFTPKVCKEWFGERINRRMMCAGYKEGGRDSCAGDSGGPLILESKKKTWVQIGSVSFGDGCGLAKRPGIYFRTTEMQQWFRYISNYRAGRAENRNDTGATWCLTP